MNELEFDSIVPRYDFNARKAKSYNDESFVALKDSIRDNGLIEPLIVQEIEGQWYLIAGYRRYTAIKNLIYNGSLPKDYRVKVAIDGTATDLESLEVAVLNRQLQNKKFLLSEELKAYLTLNKVKTLAEVSKDTGSTVEHIRQVLSYQILFEDETVADLADDGIIPKVNLTKAARAALNYPEKIKNILTLLRTSGGLAAGLFEERLTRVTLTEWEPPGKREPKRIRGDEVNSLIEEMLARKGTREKVQRGVPLSFDEIRPQGEESDFVEYTLNLKPKSEILRILEESSSLYSHHVQWVKNNLFVVVEKESEDKD